MQSHHYALDFIKREEAFDCRLTKARQKNWTLKAGNSMLNMKQDWKDHPKRGEP